MADGGAWRRFRADRPAFGAAVALVGLALFAFLGPLFAPVAFDADYPDYVKAAPSLRAHPSPEEAKAALQNVADHMHVKIEASALADDSVSATLSSQRPI